MTFSVSITVRGYELDTQGHLNQAVYLQYAEHARWELLRAAGLGQEKLIGSGVGPVLLEQNIKYLRELRSGEEVQITCEFDWQEGKVFAMRHQVTRSDGTPSAEIRVVGGLLNLATRKLDPRPSETFRSLADYPELLNLA